MWLQRPRSMMTHSSCSCPSRLHGDNSWPLFVVMMWKNLLTGNQNVCHNYQKIIPPRDHGSWLEKLSTSMIVSASLLKVFSFFIILLQIDLLGVSMAIEVIVLKLRLKVFLHDSTSRHHLENENFHLQKNLSYFC